MVEGGTAAEARQALTNIRNVLETAGSSMDKVQYAAVLCHGDPQCVSLSVPHPPHASRRAGGQGDRVVGGFG